MHSLISHIEIGYERESAVSQGGAAKVGWLLTEEKASIIYFPPERLSTAANNRSHGKSAGRCPAVLNLESRYFVIKCPFDIHLGFERDARGKPTLINKAGEAAAIRANKLRQKIHLTPEAEWRHEERPIIQLSLPYLFIADEPIYLSQVASFAHYRKEQLPGTIFGGRFPIDIWPRQLMWAFEWNEIGQDLKLKRGEPLFYCQFEADAPDRSIQMIEARWTPELRNYVEKISGAVNFVNQTFSLFKAAEEVRPKKLLEAIER